jgi:hypothetical protein
LAEVEAEARCGGCRNAVTSMDWIKPSRFIGFMFLSVFHHQFVAVVEHNWTAWEKVTLLLSFRGRPLMFCPASL